MKKFLKPEALFPILLGLAGGPLLFLLADMDDAPGMSLIGLVIGFLLIMWGVNNSGVIKKGFLAPILLLCFGVGGVLLSIVLLLNSEFEESLGIALIGAALGVVLIVIGMMRLRKARMRIF